MKLPGFLKSKKFWLGVAHLAVIAGGAYESYAHGTATPAIATAVANALIKSPLAN